MKQFIDNIFVKIKDHSIKVVIIVVVILISIGLLLGITISRNRLSSFSVKELEIQFSNSLKEALSEQGSFADLKDDAFFTVDESNFEDEEGLISDDRLVEQILNNFKMGEYGFPDGDLIDSQKNITSFNNVWNREDKFDDIFRKNISFTQNQHKIQIDTDYINQRSVKDIGYVICVPTSAVIVLSGLGIDIDIEHLIDYFQNDSEVEAYAWRNYYTLNNQWIVDFIREKKLYQVTGIFVFGMNEYLQKYYPEFKYKFNYDYWSINQIAYYVENYFALLSATFFTSYFRDGTLEGGHMISIVKVYRDDEGNIIAFGVTDPFGNPLWEYEGAYGLDGENVLVDIDTMEIIMKSHFTDVGGLDDPNVNGRKDLKRVLYLEPKD